MFLFLNITIVVILVVFFYLFDIITPKDFSIILTTSTFLFSILAGFFISRQGNRYSEIRNLLTEFDGHATNVFRQLNHHSAKLQEEMRKHILKSYKAALLKQGWDFFFEHKSKLMVDMHNILVSHIGKKKLNDMEKISINKVLDSTKDMQILRKKLLVLQAERIPPVLWMLMSILSFVLIYCLANISSYGDMSTSALKATFVFVILFVMFILKKFDRLDFFEEIIGEKSAMDVVEILKVKRGGRRK